MKFAIAAFLLSLLTQVFSQENETGVVLGTLDVIAAGEEDLTDLVDALNVSGLIGVLADPSTNYTVFAPINDAFETFPSKLLDPAWNLHLQGVLLTHVAKGYVTSTMLTDGMEITTVFVGFNEAPVVVSLASGVSFSSPSFGPSTVVEADLLALNGVIHKVDTYFLPYFMTVTLWDLAGSQTEFSTISTLIVQAGLETVLQGDAITVFAPDNNAFAQIPPELYSQISDNQELVTAILSKHVARGVYPKSSLVNNTDLTTVNDETLTVTIVGMGQFADVKINGASIQVPDQLANNGIVHIITAVLYELPDVESPATTPSPAGAEPTDMEPTGEAPVAAPTSDASSFSTITMLAAAALAQLL